MKSPLDPKLVDSLSSMGLLSRFKHDIIRNLEIISRNYCISNYSNNFDHPVLDEFTLWFQTEVKIRLNGLIKDLDLDFDTILYNILLDIRINEIFDIVVNYPNSISALQDIGRNLGFEAKIKLLDSLKSQYNHS